MPNHWGYHKRIRGSFQLIQGQAILFEQNGKNQQDQKMPKNAKSIFR